ncbi:hypothetical protein SDC9_23558 [bioreactor metagenome]|uniref:Uncharacterized protein n=1 Tax=bioreactor metagenome TaxID=1076179 RepID=A0A644UFN7_9ZZZZ
MTDSNEPWENVVRKSLDPKKVQIRIQQAQTPKQPIEPKKKGSK